MISNPNLIHYACIAKGTTVVAEFNSKNADLAALAARCLEKAPPHHDNFFHTVRGKTYIFLIDEPFIYFAIYVDSLEKSEGLAFLRKVREAFDEIIVAEGVERLQNLSSHCYQGEFNPVFHRLLAPQEDMEAPHTPKNSFKLDRSGSLDSMGKKIGFVPLLGGDYSKILKKKKKKRSSMEANGKGKGGSAENKLDVSDDSIALYRDYPAGLQKNGLFGADAGQRAKKVWKKHVWVVLSMDLIICSILFGVWLWICRGFKCIDG